MESLEILRSMWTTKRMEVISTNRCLISQVRYCKEVGLDLDLDNMIQKQDNLFTSFSSAHRAYLDELETVVDQSSHCQALNTDFLWIYGKVKDAKKQVNIANKVIASIRKVHDQPDSKVVIPDSDMITIVGEVAEVKSLDNVPIIELLHEDNVGGSGANKPGAENLKIQNSFDNEEEILKGEEISSDYNGLDEPAGVTRFKRSKVRTASKEIKTADKLRQGYTFAHTIDEAVMKKLGHSDANVLLRPKHQANKFEAATMKYEGKDDDNGARAVFIADNKHGMVNHNSRFKKPIVVALYDVDYVENIKGTNYWRNRIRKVTKGHEFKGGTSRWHTKKLPRARQKGYHRTDQKIRKGHKMNTGKVTKGSFHHGKVKVPIPKKFEKMKPLGGECETEYCGTGAQLTQLNTSHVENTFPIEPYSKPRTSTDF